MVWLGTLVFMLCSCRPIRYPESNVMVAVLLGFLFAPKVSSLITVDQFGWTPSSKKIAVLADPIEGQNSNLAFIPAPKFQICQESDGKVVFTGSTSSWYNGLVSSLAGDRVWFADFSDFKEPGRYYLLDPSNNVRSYPFSIGDDVYRKVAIDAARTYYYQRANVEIPAKYGGKWTQPASHVGEGQDRAALLTKEGQADATPRNVTGGWYDAGDPNKYVPFLSTTMFNLFLAYETNPSAFGDDTNIPESGNGASDLLDHLKYELDWLLKMQDDDGGVFNRNGDKTYSAGSGPWSSDIQPRFYTSKTTWATATATATFAHASRIFAGESKAFPDYAEKLKAAALKGWAYLEKHPKMDPASGEDGGKLAAAGAGSNENGDRRERLYAAAELWRTTGDAKFKTIFEAGAKPTQEKIDATSENNLHPLKGTVDPLNAQSMTQALFVYCQSKEADPVIAEPFKKSLSATSKMILGNTAGKEDPYLAYHLSDHYCWGSNANKGYWGRILVMATALDLDKEKQPKMREVAEGYLHFLHGRNPLGLCYLSNMGADGASNSIQHPYHHWWSSIHEAAPGYLAGGPNKFFSVMWIKPPYGEPPMKAYKDWDGAWNAEHNANENSWEVTEPAIYYQASYLLLLSFAMKKPGP